MNGRANQIGVNGRLKSCGLALTVALLAFTATAASLPPNLARSAKATATSEYSGQYTAQFAVDGKIPEAGSQDDLSQAWCVRAFGEAFCFPRFEAGLRPIPKGLWPPAQGCEERATLGDEPPGSPTPTGLWPFWAVPRRNPVGVEARSLPVSQGSLACSATLGFGTESLWDSKAWWRGEAGSRERGCEAISSLRKPAALVHWDLLPKRRT